MQLRPSAASVAQRASLDLAFANSSRIRVGTGSAASAATSSYAKPKQAQSGASGSSILIKVRHVAFRKAAKPSTFLQLATRLWPNVFVERRSFNRHAQRPTPRAKLPPVILGLSHEGFIHDSSMPL
jgi:hypothetical protein